MLSFLPLVVQDYNTDTAEGPNTRDREGASNTTTKEGKRRDPFISQIKTTATKHNFGFLKGGENWVLPMFSQNQRNRIEN
jgi:hypothetical protein